VVKITSHEGEVGISGDLSQAALVNAQHVESVCTLHDCLDHFFDYVVLQLCEQQGWQRC